MKLRTKIFILAVVGVAAVLVLWDVFERREMNIKQVPKTIEKGEGMGKNEILLSHDYKVLVKYQRLRNSRVPLELAELQAHAIVTAAKASALPVTLLVGIIETESLFDPLTLSSAKAAGLMQILQEDGVDIDPDRRFDISYNIEKGCEILRSKLKKENGDLPLALLGYSGGALGYSERVYEAAGRFAVYRERAKEIQLVANEGGGK